MTAPLCPCGAILGPKNRSGSCRPCNAVRLNADPAFTAKRAAGIRARASDPAQREIMREKMRHAAASLTPEQQERRREHGRRQLAVYLKRPDVVARNQSPEVRLAAGRKRSATALAWCPEEWRDTYRDLLKKGRRAAEAKRMVRDMIAGKTVVLYALQKQQLAWCPEEYRGEYKRLRLKSGADEARRIVEAEMRKARLRFYDAAAAADFLRRLAPITRCRPDGSADPCGTHWRRGSTVLTGEDVVERALLRDWQPDAWRRIAA